jgi:anti-anti-sigma factor
MSTQRFDIRREGTDVIVRAAGEVDAYLAPALRRSLDEALETAGDARVLVDLGPVEFLDSTALGTVVGAYRRAGERGVRFAIVPPRGHARRIFALTGLDGVLPLTD